MKKFLLFVLPLLCFFSVGFTLEYEWNNDFTYSHSSYTQPTRSSWTAFYVLEHDITFQYLSFAGDHASSKTPYIWHLYSINKSHSTSSSFSYTLIKTGGMSSTGIFDNISGTKLTGYNGYVFKFLNTDSSNWIYHKTSTLGIYDSVITGLVINGSVMSSTTTFTTQVLQPRNFFNKIEYILHSSSDPSIDINYNGNTDNIECDGTNEINLEQGIYTKISDYNYKYNGLTGINIFRQDNFGLTREDFYDKQNLYLEKQNILSYTGGAFNYWVLDPNCAIGSTSFSGFSPSFDITGSVIDEINSGNVFMDFQDKSFKVLLTNLPSYIQRVFIIAFLLFILRLATRLGRRR